MEEYICDASEILKRLLESKVKGTIIGVTASTLGTTMVLAGIDDVLLGKIPMVVLKPYDTYGYILPETKIHLEDISSVRPFASKFQNPFEKKLNSQNRMQA